MFLTGRLDANSEEKALLLDQLDPANEVIRREVAGLVVHLRGVMAAEANDSARVQALWSVVYSRAARADEVADALAHVHAVSQMRGEASFAWQNLAQALLASNEFMHVE